MPSFRRGKIILLILLAATAAVPPLFIRLDEPSTRLQVYKFLAKIGSLSGTMFLFWQFLLGFRGAVGRLFPDFLWLIAVHRTIGKHILLLIIFHPVFITFYYLDKYHRNLLLLEMPVPDQASFVILGMIALALLGLVVATGLARQSFTSISTWYGFHLTSYLMLPLVFIHSFPLGMTVRKTGLWFIWWGLAAALAVLFLFRLGVKVGWLARKHRVSAVDKVGPGVTRIAMRPLGSKVEPATGQFIYLRRGAWGAARPFTVSHYDRETGEIAVTVKALGRTTTRLQATRPGETVYIEGPYGVFTREALASGRPLVMIAGGIGITPFTRLCWDLAGEPGRELHLFYGNKNTGEIVYREEIEGTGQMHVVHVLSDDPDYPGEKGFITVELLKRHLVRALGEYEFLICGPPVMTEKLQESLARESVPAGQIHHELFSY